eukprot:TRINITY_DN5723_c0_g2_i2.p1 TRINITY_DN5723_c0_g2~~TRINITY_DN5723_c0_g2_i2.p1  ORF type:complete len:122 (+),score=34.57 TRINITY_DN5723_c0_g2_i2:92-457(+)
MLRSLVGSEMCIRDRDKEWLLGRDEVPAPHVVADNVGNVTEYVRSTDGEVLVGFTKAHGLGFTMGGLAHVSEEYMQVLYDVMGLEAMFEADAARRQLEASTTTEVPESATGANSSSRCVLL